MDFCELKKRWTTINFAGEGVFAVPIGTILSQLDLMANFTAVRHQDLPVGCDFRAVRACECAEYDFMRMPLSSDLCVYARRLCVGIEAIAHFRRMGDFYECAGDLARYVVARLNAHGLPYGYGYSLLPCDGQPVFGFPAHAVAEYAHTMRKLLPDITFIIDGGM